MSSHLRQPVAWLLLALLGVTGACTKPDSLSAARIPPPNHEHRAPHGGTSVVLGQEAYHLEFVLDATAGRLTAYVLDGDMENFVRIQTHFFDVTVTTGISPNRSLTFRAVANPATGESVGDTSQFEAVADWLTTATQFDAVILTLEIRGVHFRSIDFNFPKGNDHER